MTSLAYVVRDIQTSLKAKYQNRKTHFGFLGIPVRVHSASVSGVKQQDEIVNVVYIGIENSAKLNSPSETEGNRRGQQLFIVIKT